MIRSPWLPSRQLEYGRSSQCPCSKEGNLVGAIVIYRQEVLPFTEKQIELI